MLCLPLSRVNSLDFSMRVVRYRTWSNAKVALPVERVVVKLT